MTASKYLKKQLKYLTSLFPSGKYSYENDKFSGIHIVQVWPLALFDLDESYKEIETNISIDFDNLYYPESVLFISDNSLNQVTNPEFEVEGLFYGLQPMINHILPPRFVDMNQEPFVAGENNYALAA